MIFELKEQLITVVGCGGNRDKTKRPIMAGIASELSDKVVLTSDNPK
jgi:UDP-N-acetylmuramoyl-L-alanyl-D-glutamate--2,6-diaminopimelate ligase